ncbi:MAG: cysteine desulfurase [Gammaproteobacteria bacterium]|nr:cysteine desulfurase [Gammaproteobacteria bacterium]
MSTVTTKINNSTQTDFDIEAIRKDFPLLHQKIHGHPLVYLDNAATSQKPQSVIQIEKDFYETINANIHRGVHTLSDRATQSYENSREKVRQFINAKSVREIVFVRGATEAINLVASSFGQLKITQGDEIIISSLEHHANIVPWQLLCEQKGATLKIIPVFENGELDLLSYENLINPRTKLIALTHVSNAIGTVNPIVDMINTAHRSGVPVLIDGAQAVPHEKIDVQDLDCDFYVFSGHKLYGPTGVGVLYAKESLLNAMPPYQGGGEMIRMVTFTHSTYNDLPYKFEAGTPNIAGVIGLGAAIDYLNALDFSSINKYEQQLLAYATEKLLSFDDLRIIGEAENKAPVISFVLGTIHPHDIGTILDHHGIAVRAGHHCAMPLMERFGLSATVRASFAFYNTFSEIDRLIEGLHEVRRMLG